MQRTILFVLPLAVAAIGFWLLAIAPKRDEASKLETEAIELESQVEEQRLAAETAEQAREDFPRAYRRVVVLGKAAPPDDDTSSLLVQLSRLSKNAGVEFGALQTSGGEEGAEAPPPAPVQTPADTASQDEQRVENADPAAAAAAPTEATAAQLPIGAQIGPAGLPVMRYSLTVSGTFFDLADFFAGVDDLVATRDDGWVGVRGRLITVDGFDLSSEPADATAAAGTDEPASDPTDPKLDATLTITTYLTPADEGVTAGAAPTGPAPVSAAPPAPAAPSDATASTATTP
jgi:Tfp pilus assembly protein PilO